MKEIDDILNNCTQAQYSEGLAWYRTVNQYIHELAAKYNKSPYCIAAMFSALSPACSFKQNKVDLERVLFKKSRATVSTYKTNKRKALDILRNNPQTLDEALEYFSESKAPKTRAFFLNVISPEHKDVTIDRHMLRFLGVEKQWMTKKRYKKAESYFIQAAEKHNLKPHQVQAIVWCSIRGHGQ